MRSHRGFSLIEAIVGICILGGLLASLLLAGWRVSHQSAWSQQRLEGCAIADEMLGQMWSNPGSMLIGQEGQVPSRQGWLWRTDQLDSPQASLLDARVVRLSIYPPQEKNAVVSVDVIVSAATQPAGQ